MFARTQYEKIGRWVSKQRGSKGGEVGRCSQLSKGLGGLGNPGGWRRPVVGTGHRCPAQALGGGGRSVGFVWKGTGPLRAAALQFQWLLFPIHRPLQRKANPSSSLLGFQSSWRQSRAPATSASGTPAAALAGELQKGRSHAPSCLTWGRAWALRGPPMLLPRTSGVASLLPGLLENSFSQVSVPGQGSKVK